MKGLGHAHSVTGMSDQSGTRNQEKQRTGKELSAVIPDVLRL